MIRVGIAIASWDAWIRVELLQAILDRLAATEPGGDWTFAGIATRVHAPIAQARHEFCSFLRGHGGELDLLVMIDADQSLALEGGDPANPGDWLGEIVRQYLAGHPRRLLFAPTVLGYQAVEGDAPIDAGKWVRGRRDAIGDVQLLNYQVDDKGEVTRAGTGVFCVSAPAWERLRAAHDHPWHDDSKGEDVAFCDRAIACGIPIEPLVGIRTYHWPEWREPLTTVHR